MSAAFGQPPTGMPLAAPASMVQPGRNPGSRRRFVIVGCLVVATVLAIGGYFIYRHIQETERQQAYSQAVELVAAQDWDLAIAALKELGDYKDALALIVSCEENLAYNAASALLAAGDFAAALEQFEGITGFKDSASQAILCRQNLDFINAQAMFDSGNTVAARASFERLVEAGFDQAAPWVSKIDYLSAEQLLQEGRRYDAYQAFTALGSYQDAAKRAKSCLIAMPATGELWHNDHYQSDVSALKFELVAEKANHYFRVYSRGIEVVAAFVHGGESLTIDLPAGRYTVKDATGDQWWGEEDLFGYDGGYSKMIFDDGNDWFDLPSNTITTISLSPTSGGNVGRKAESLENF
jgi:tetratricopeptide (TPR) repeat protein